MKEQTIKTACIATAIFLCTDMYAQNSSTVKKTIETWDGMMVAGYVNNGGFVNFGGPTIKLIKKPWSFGFGILPTMRIKEDNVVNGANKNSIVTPTAGFGFTVVYKHFVLQMPFYYNAKTGTAYGKWNVGAGIGFKLY